MLIHNKGDFTFFLANNHNSLAVKLTNKKMEMKSREGKNICKSKKKSEGVSASFGGMFRLIN